MPATQGKNMAFRVFFFFSTYDLLLGLMKTGLIEVQFVDYGNTDYVSDDRVKSLDADLVQYPIQCYR